MVTSAQTPQRRLRRAHTSPRTHTAPLRQESPVTPQRRSWSPSLIQRNRQLTSQVSTIGVLGSKLTSNKRKGAVPSPESTTPNPITEALEQTLPPGISTQHFNKTESTAAESTAPRPSSSCPDLTPKAVGQQHHREHPGTEPRDNQTLQHRALTGTPIFCHKPSLRLSPHIHSVLHKLSKLTFLRGLPKGRETTRK